MSDCDLDEILNKAIEEVNKTDIVYNATIEANTLFEEFKKVFYEEYPEFIKIQLNLSISEKK